VYWWFQALVRILFLAPQRKEENDAEEQLDELNDYFESMVEVKRIRNGEHQTLETLINEEALLFAKYLIGEIRRWEPRIASF
jgi:hypothetical protein